MRISDWSSDVCSSDLGETAFFIGPHFFVSVRHGSARTHTDVRARLETLPAKLAHGPDYVLYAVLDFIVDGYFPVIDAIEERMLRSEERRVGNACVSTCRSRGSTYH